MFFLKESLGFPIASTNSPSLTAQSFDCLGHKSRYARVWKSRNRPIQGRVPLCCCTSIFCISAGFKPKARKCPTFFSSPTWPGLFGLAMQRCTPRRWGTGKTWQINFLGPFLLTEFLARRRERDLMGPDGTWSAGRFFLGQPKMANGTTP